MAYLDENGLLYVWQKIKNYIASQSYITINDVPEGAAATTTTPKMDGTAAVGTETAFARGDHVHPTDTSRASAGHTHPSYVNQNAFSVVSVRGQSYKVEADSATDTVIFSAGSNLSITTNSSTDTVTFAVTGVASSAHTHPISLETSNGTSVISLEPNSKYQLTAGGSNIIFTTPDETIQLTISNGKVQYNGSNIALDDILSLLQSGKEVVLSTTIDQQTVYLRPITWDGQSFLSFYGVTEDTVYIGIMNDPYDAGISLYADPTSKIYYGSCQTGTNNDKTLTISNYKLRANTLIYIKFDYPVKANQTLNISSTGERAIWYRGSLIKDNIIKAGDRVTFLYNGSQYNIVSIDRWGDDINTLQTAVTSHTSQIAAISAAIPSAADLLPTVSASDNGQVLTVVGGAWNKAEVPQELYEVNYSSPSYSDTVAAINAGKIPYTKASINSGSYLLYFTVCYGEGEGIRFEGTNMGKVYVNTLRSTNQWTTTDPSELRLAPLSSPIFTGTPQAPTAAASTSNNQIATTSFVGGAIATTTSSITSAYTNAITTATSNITSAYQTAIASAVTNMYKYKGVKATASALPSTGNTVGDIWHVSDTNDEYAWDGSNWEPMGGVFSIPIITNSQIDTYCT